VDDIVVPIEEKIHFPRDALLVGIKRAEPDFVAITVNHWQHAVAAKQHGHRLAGLEPLAHLHQQEIVGAVG
jgi:hypothetical protein